MSSDRITKLFQLRINVEIDTYFSDIEKNAPVVLPPIVKKDRRKR